VKGFGVNVHSRNVDFKKFNVGAQQQIGQPAK
jgi:hypothetical protein